MTVLLPMALVNTWYRRRALRLNKGIQQPGRAQGRRHRLRESPGFSAGAIYAVLVYVYDYLEGLNQVPTVVNNLARLKDVRARLAASSPA